VQIRPVVERANATSLVMMSCWTLDQVRPHAPRLPPSTTQRHCVPAGRGCGDVHERVGAAAAERYRVGVDRSARIHPLRDTPAPSPLNPPPHAHVNAGEGGSQFFTPQQQRDLWSDLLARGVRGFSMAAQNVTPAFVQAAHARLMPVNVWTVDDADDVNAFIDMGVDGILTNDVAAVGDIVAKRAAQALARDGGDGGDGGLARTEPVAIGIGAGLGGVVLGAMLYHFARRSRRGVKWASSSSGGGVGGSGTVAGVGGGYASLPRSEPV